MYKILVHFNKNTYTCTRTYASVTNACPRRQGGQLLSMLSATKRNIKVMDSAKDDSETTTQKEERTTTSPPTMKDDTDEGLIGSIGMWALWAALIAYTLFVSPNQTPLRDSYFLEKLIVDTGDGVTINAVFKSLFFIMGVWPLAYTALLVPAGKSANGVKSWPFLVASYGVGAFALLPFMAIWQPASPKPQLPPARKDLEGISNLVGAGMESPILAYALLAGALLCIGQAAFAGSAAWQQYIKLLEESRFVHTTTLDFLTLTSLAPFWMANDAELRNWEGRRQVLPLLSVVPVLGPLIYLCLRPKAQ